MAKSDIFVIDGDTVLKAPAKSGNARSASTQSPTLSLAADPPPSRIEGSGRRGSGRPAAAASLSLWVWGSGQWLNGDRDLALLLVMSQGLIAALHYFVVMTWAPIRKMAHVFFIDEWELLLIAAALDFWLIFLMLYNVSQGFRSAERQAGHFRGLKMPLVSGLASTLVPGWGQILNGQLRKGLFFLFVFVVQAYLLAFYLLTPLYRIVSDLDPNQLLLREVIRYGKIFLGASALLWLVSAYDAVLVARYTRTRAS
jgi:O-antigen/teichoic acid export membrane protein